MELRDYQQQCVRRAFHGFRQYRRQMIRVATGGGKTIIFSEMAGRLALAPDRPRRTLILAHRRELITQAAEKLEAHNGIAAGIEQGKGRPSIRDRVVVGSVQTMIGTYQRYPEDFFDFVVIDECHHALAKTYQEPLGYFGNHARILGVTATPESRLGRYFENMPFDIGLVDLICAGWLVPIKVKTFPLDIDLAAIKPGSGDWSDKKVGNALDPWLQSIANRLGQQIGDRKTLIFVPVRKTSVKLVEYLRAAGITAMHVDGDSKDREKILAVHGREFQVLVNAMLLTEGYDDPEISCVMVLRPTNSEILFSQAVGRGTRLCCPFGCRRYCQCAGAKRDLLLLDPLWLHETNNLVRPANLVTADDEEQAAVRKHAVACEGMFDLIEVARDAAAQREKRLADELEEKRKRKERVIDLSDWSRSIGSPELLTFQPTKDWHTGPLTDKQIAMLKKLHISPDQVSNRGHANAIITTFISKRTKPKTEEIPA